MVRQRRMQMGIKRKAFTDIRTPAPPRLERPKGAGERMRLFKLTSYKEFYAGMV
jgi:hypothetical protein